MCTVVESKRNQVRGIPVAVLRLASGCDQNSASSGESKRKRASSAPCEFICFQQLSSLRIYRARLGTYLLHSTNCSTNYAISEDASGLGSEMRENEKNIFHLVIQRLN